MNMDIGRKELIQTLVSRMKSYVHQVRRYLLAETAASYWTRYNVTLHRSFQSAEESLAYFHWRNDQYIDYIKLMSVEGRTARPFSITDAVPGTIWSGSKPIPDQPG